MLFLKYLGLAQNSKCPRGENGARIARAKWLERAQIPCQLKSDRSRTNLTIDREHRL